MLSDFRARLLRAGSGQTSSMMKDWPVLSWKVSMTM
jgi:hypothetical protein